MLECKKSKPVDRKNRKRQFLASKQGDLLFFASLKYFIIKNTIGYNLCYFLLQKILGFIRGFLLFIEKILKTERWFLKSGNDS